MLHETSNACTIIILWLFFIDCDACKVSVDSTWGCSVDVVVVILLVSTIVESHKICNVPI